ncbi:MAG: malonic semialdehyde reductase [Alphaproteobacteria bacterium CG11_big_fil_rev_8_21_14_0_20_44_7]|nr:MAG: malonic semialdehyde reductase [Alphaproteobacteria bacterium CG11_big_fil_rev_8_21_14_0_20_44_7]
MTEINQQALDVIFNDARTHSAWLEKDVPDELLQKAYDLAKIAPTSANCQPMRIVFVKSDEAKARLKPHLAEGNVEKTMQAPVCAIIAHDMEFYNELPWLFPHADAKSWFEGNEEAIKQTAFRNGSLQGAYFILACRAVGLDCGPMSGFNNDGVDAEFLDGTKWKSNFLINIGYGDSSKLHPRSPRPDFNKFCKIA